MQIGGAASFGILSSINEWYKYATIILVWFGHLIQPRWMVGDLVITFSGFSRAALSFFCLILGRFVLRANKVDRTWVSDSSYCPL